MTQDHRRKQIIAEYRAAYEAANGKPIEVRYASGWYQIGRGWRHSSHREREIIAFTANLKNRARATPDTKDNTP